MTTTSPSGFPSAPPQPPTAADEADRDQFGKFVDAATKNVQDSAEKWRTGLAALVTLSTTALLISGPTSSADLEGGARLIVVGLLATGLVAAVAGLWLALSAASGVPTIVTYAGIRAKFSSMRAFEVANASRAVRKLNWARRLVAISLVAFLAGMVCWWLAPKAEPSITVFSPAGKFCGRLESADNHVFRVLVQGESAPRDIPFDQVTNVAVVSGCE
jgi:hypothetical protein